MAVIAAQDGTLASGRDLALLIGAGTSESVELSQKLSQDFGIPPEEVLPALGEIRKSFDPKNYCYFGERDELLNSFPDFLQSALQGLGVVKRVPINTVTAAIKNDPQCSRRSDAHRYAAQWAIPYFEEVLRMQ
ncbi:hypothetical protein HYU14_06650 [Candidatus Woesearchaeota archaeon]|nr:hypothetical protein [Candidatus Woesearchaeota archaeon]